MANVNFTRVTLPERIDTLRLRALLPSLQPTMTV
jgi:hypothetical protein